ncbi:histidine phosphatase family protein [Roseomonas genomospecies 6]|uniref:histidine phosphatase family protein n=1 Tax=Roseomonas genomospecies 6 TaxID=214106 RepID=UPI00256FFC20|nr:histidine phosphatase family protein [Roseomonas genomospecies 6]
METILLLLRHASHDRLGSVLCGRMPGVTLSEAGRREADALAFALARHRLAAVLSSPMERAVETAVSVATSQALSVEVDEDLNELDLGAWSGMRFEALRGDPAWELWNRARSHARPPGGETMLEAQARMARCIGRLHRRFAGRTVALVSHADVIKAALAHALGLSADFHARFEIAPASRSVLIAGEWGLKVHSINEAPA